MRQSILLLALFLLSGSFFIGCGGSDGNQVIQPAGDYQLTEQEKKNAAATTGKPDPRDKTGFSGN